MMTAWNLRINYTQPSLLIQITLCTITLLAFVGTQFVINRADAISVSATFQLN